MYKIIIKSEDLELGGTVELNELKDFFDECQISENVDKFSLSNLFDNIDYGITILKPTKDDEDFIFLYASNIFWNDFSPNLNKYLIGRKLSQVLKKNDKLKIKLSLNHVLSENKRVDSVIKLYENDKLIKAWSEFKLDQNGLLYICMKDQTDYYLEKQKEDNIFNYATLPNLQVDNNYNILQVNNLFKKVLNYTVDDLNKRNLDNIVYSFNSEVPGVNNFKEALDYVFKNKKLLSISELCLVAKNHDYKWFKSFVRIIDEDTAQISFIDFSELKASKENELNLTDYFADIQKVSKTAMSMRKGKLVKWSPEIYNILEIEEDFDDSFKDNFIYDYMLPGYKLELDNLFNNLDNDESLSYIYKVKTGKGNIKVLNGIFKIRYEKGEKLILGFTQDITDEYVAQEEALALKDNFSLIQESSNIVIAVYKEGKYSFTSQVYNILGVKPGDFPDTVDFVHEFIIPEDEKKWYDALNLSPKHSTSNVTYRVKGPNNKLRYIYCQNKGIFDENGEIIRVVGFLMDVTDETLARQSSMELQKSLERVQNFSKVVIVNYKNGNFIFTSEIYNILEIDPNDYPENIDLIQEFTVPSNSDVFEERIKELTPENKHIRLFNKVITKKGKVKFLESFVDAEFNDNGDLINIVCLLQDITNKIETEHELKQLSEDRKVLLQEVHHRVKNNLQLILSFLNLEVRFNKDNPEFIINNTRNRIKTMALTHEEVYQSPNVSSVNMETFLNEGVSNLFNLYTTGYINLHFNIESINMGMDKSIPLGLLVNEVALNTIKYAFPEKDKGNFYIKLERLNSEIILSIWDDGVGLPEGVDLFNSDSLGFIIIRNLSQQLEAELSQINEVSGFGLQLKFKI